VQLRPKSLFTLAFLLVGTMVLALAVSGCRTAEVADNVGGNLFSKGGIAVRTQPSGAMVYINERFVGRAPLMESVRSGVYRLVVKKRGYETQDLWVEVAKGRTEEVVVRLERQ